MQKTQLHFECDGCMRQKNIIDLYNYIQKIDMRVATPS